MIYMVKGHLNSCGLRTWVQSSFHSFLKGLSNILVCLKNNNKNKNLFQDLFMFVCLLVLFLRISEDLQRF